MHVTIEITETESVGNFSTSKTAYITVPPASTDRAKEYPEKEAFHDSETEEVIRQFSERLDELQGMAFNFATFYVFCQRVSVGESNPGEIAFMTRMFDLIEKRGDWNTGVNDYMA